MTHDDRACLALLTNAIRTHEVIEHPRLVGDTFGWLLAQNLALMEGRLGYTRLNKLPNTITQSIEAFLSYDGKTFWLADFSLNHQARALIHEIVHHIIFSWRDGHKLAPQESHRLDEVLVESTVFLAGSRINFDTSRYSVPYLLLYGGLELIEPHSDTIIRLADGYEALTRPP